MLSPHAMTARGEQSRRMIMTTSTTNETAQSSLCSKLEAALADLSEDQHEERDEIQQMLRIAKGELSAPQRDEEAMLDRLSDLIRQDLQREEEGTS